MMLSALRKLAVSLPVGFEPGRKRFLTTSCVVLCSQKPPVEEEILITRHQAKDLIYRLHQKERRILLEELQRYNTQNAQDRLTTRSMGRIHSPTAKLQQVCPGPETHEPPTASQLRAIMLHNGLPFIGFGFLDNFIMICAGDYIDMTLGLTFGISTMAAAGLGNAISDVAGIGSAWYVERVACRVGVEVPNLTPEQLDMTSTRISSTFGRAFGVFLGCIIGMCPLLFLDTKDDKDDKDDDTDTKKSRARRS